MKNLFIVGTAGSGKTAIALGLAQKFRDEGMKVSYFKPVGTAPAPNRPDEDGILMKHALEMEAPLDVIVPHTAGPTYLSSYDSHCAGPSQLEKIISAHRQISANTDITLIDGAVFPYSYSGCGLDSISLARDLEAELLLVVKIKNDYTFDATVFFQDYLKVTGMKSLGCIFNHVPRPLLAKTEGIYKLILEERGMKTLGIIPRRARIASPTVAEYHEVLGGEILAGEDKMDLLVEDVVVGAMTMESALTYLRRAANKAVILGGDRSDLALAALETHTSVLILTGGLYPNVRVVARAAEKGVPVILVHYDTYTTIEKLNEVSRHIKPGDKAAIKIAKENIEQYCDWQAILNAFK